jgi:glycosyltransferase involved in cell wall biosynthesis
MHIVARLESDSGNEVVELIEAMDRTDFRHMVVALAECDPVLAQRLSRCGARCMPLHYRPWLGGQVLFDLYNVFNLFPPAIVQVSNRAAMALIPALMARVPVRLHEIDDVDMPEPDGLPWHTWLHFRFYQSFTQQCVASSWRVRIGLERDAGIVPQRLKTIRSGVDIRRFRPAKGGHELYAGSPFNGPRLIVIGSVGALDYAHDPLRLIRAFARAKRMFGDFGARLRLVIAGDGPLRGEVEDLIKRGGLNDRIWLVGGKFDLPVLLRSFDFFALCSRGADVSATVLAAMASGLAMVVTRGGAQDELVKDGKTGFLVPSETSEIAGALAHLAVETGLRLSLGQAARERVEKRFDIHLRANLYTDFYRQCLNATGTIQDRETSVPATSTTGGLIPGDESGQRVLSHVARLREKRGLGGSDGAVNGVKR